MRAPVYVFDPTQADALSRVRGIGRYIQIWRENAPSDWVFTTDVHSVPSHAFFIQPFFTFFQKPLITGRIADRQIAVIHDLIPQKYPSQFPVGLKGNLFELWSKWILHTHIDHVITDSEASKEDIVKLLNRKPDTISVLYPTLAKAFWSESGRPVTPPGSYCIYVGDGTWNKNLVTIARAVQKANITCMFVGKIFEDPDPEKYTSPWQAEIRQFFQIAQFDKRFIFAGYVSDKQLFQLYQQARLNLLVSRDEGFGFSFVEAATFGCPSILADRPIFKEIAGDDALFCDPDDVDSLARFITQLFNDEVLYRRMAEKASIRAQQYGADKFKTALADVVYRTGYTLRT
jgi:glycosyltransferase involved in cell wall biosynthesis